MTLSYERLDFGALPGWQHDDHVAALRAFARSSDMFFANGGAATSVVTALNTAIGDGCAPAARLFFEHYFEPQRIGENPEPGLVTGYYEPHLEVSRIRTSEFPYPIYRRPPDLINQIDDSMRGALSGMLTHLRSTPEGLKPFPTREEIDNGVLDGQNLEFAFVANAIDLFVLHIQGSGLLTFPDGSRVRIGYDGKNGHPYTSIGRHLINASTFSEAELTMPVLVGWLEADAARARQVMWINKSYIFFRELDDDTDGPLGVDGITLSPGRSLAVDGGFHPIGRPIYVIAPELADTSATGQFNRLMIAQDAGSAIRGAERGDIFFGSGKAAGERAGKTKHGARFVILKPRWVGSGAS